MTKHSLYIAFVSVLVTLLFSCKNEEKQITDREVSVDASALDFSTFIDRYHNVMDSLNYNITEDNAVWATNQIGQFCIESYSEVNPQTLYTVTDFLSLNHNELISWVEMYNSLISMNSIYSLIELWMRGEQTNRSMDYAWLANTIKAFDVDSLFNDEARNAIIKVQDDLYQLFSQIEQLDEDSVCKPNSWNVCDSLLAAQYQAIMASKNEELIDSIGNINRYDWKSLQNTDEWQAILVADGDSAKVELFFNALNNSLSFEEQCQLALCGGSVIPDVVLVPVMKELLLCGKYSRYIFVLWDGWRCYTQTHFYGRSRDSVIADDLYNIVRKKAFLTTLYYIDQNLEDSGAIYNLSALSSQPCIIRNGSYMIGNDASLTEWDLFHEE